MYQENSWSHSSVRVEVKIKYIIFSHGMRNNSCCTLFIFQWLVMIVKYYAIWTTGSSALPPHPSSPVITANRMKIHGRIEYIFPLWSIDDAVLHNRPECYFRLNSDTDEKQETMLEYLRLNTDIKRSVKELTPSLS